MAGESSSSISESRKVKDVLRRNPWPPEIKLKPKEIRNSPKMSDKVAETRQRTDEPMLAGKVYIHTQYDNITKGYHIYRDLVTSS